MYLAEAAFVTINSTTVTRRSLRKFSELELEDDFTELQLAPEVCGLYPRCVRACLLSSVYLIPY